MEANPEAESSWTETCQQVADQTLFSKGESLIFGANIPCKTNTVMFYMAGLAEYRQALGNVSGNNYQGFQITEVRSNLASASVRSAG